MVVGQSCMFKACYGKERQRAGEGKRRGLLQAPGGFAVDEL